MKDNNLRNLPADDEYARLLAEAYPGPKRDIRSAVMAQIAAEDSKILKSKKKGRWSAEVRNRFVRYGSMAACLVLLTVLGFRVLPMMGDIVAPETADMEMELRAADAAMDVQAPTEEMPETRAATTSEAVEENGASSNYFKVQTYSGEPIEEEGEEMTVVEEEVTDGTVAEAAPLAPVEEAVVEEEAPAVEKAPVEEAVVEEAPAAEPTTEALSLPLAGEIIVEKAVEQAIAEEAPAEEAADQGGILYSVGMSGAGANSDAVYSGTATVPQSLSYTSEGCLHGAVFGNSFHDIPRSVMNLVTSYADAAEAAAWCEDNAGSCDMNIYELLTAFDIPRDAFEALYTTTDLWYHHDYNTEVLYDGDRAAVYEYYRNGGDTAFAARYFMYELKLALYTEAGAKVYGTWAGERGYTAFVQWSLAEFVRDFGVSRERFAELYDETAARFTEHYPAEAVPTYDVEGIYTAEIGADVPGYVADAMYTIGLD